ncbi:MAG: DUF2027 domain-containing protein [Paludibacteraceae bacterium]|nr:DUF2027 domain-containing protein [Paludibacteraceae bacterium]
MVKVGDRVRFLNATGGGVVSKIVNREMVLVTDDDGFDVPTLVRECVVVDSGENRSENKSAASQNIPSKEKKIEDVVPEQEDDDYDPGEETKEGETLNVFLAYLPQDPKKLSVTDYDCYLVNDSNYYLGYNVASGNGSMFISRAAGFIQPNTKLLLEEVKKEQLNDLEILRVQLMPFKQKKAYKVKPAYDAQIKINPVKFYKLHSFTENDYFEEDAMLFPIVKNDGLVEREISAESVSEILKNKETKLPAKVSVSSKPKQEIVEIDLHIEQLLDNTTGMSNGDMLQYQIDKFHEVMQQYAKSKGQKIVFIHGKGDGVLRKEILQQLKHKYASCYVQDASFLEYGYGATMVTIK